MITEDRWLGSLLGRPAFQIETETETGSRSGELADTVRAHMGGQREAMYYAKVETTHVACVRALMSAGLYVADVSVTLRHERTAKPGGASEYQVREVTPPDHEAVLDIAGSCFRYSRFHLDPAIPRETADRIKRTWVESYVQRSRGDRLFVASDGGRPVGFLAALTMSRDGETVAVIDLVGVAAAAQRRGIGRSLARHFLKFYHACDAAEVGTQAANVPSLRLYESFGFSIVRTVYVLHGHVGRA